MDMRLGHTEASASDKVSFWPVYLCFMVFGVLIPFSRTDFTMTTMLLSLVVSLAVGVLNVNLLIMVFNSANADLRQADSHFARQSVSAGMLFMIPFTVLAVLALALLSWNAVMPFASAAIMTAAATAGAEVMKKGAQGVKNVLIPSALAFIFSTGWMMLVAVLP